MPTKIGIRELNSRLSECVSAVGEGHELTITSHGKAVARMVPVEAEDPLERLRRQGLLIEATAPPPDIEAWDPIETSGSVIELITNPD